MPLYSPVKKSLQSRVLQKLFATQDEFVWTRESYKKQRNESTLIKNDPSVLVLKLFDHVDFM